MITRSSEIGVRRYVSKESDAVKLEYMHRVAMLAYLTGDPVILSVDSILSNGTNFEFNYIRVVNN